MPPGGVENRSEQLALVAGLLHERGTDPRLGELLAARRGLRPARRSRRARRRQRPRRSGGSTTGSSGCRGRWSRTSPARPRWPRRPGPSRARRGRLRALPSLARADRRAQAGRGRVRGVWRTSRTTRCSRTTSPGLRSAVVGRLFEALRPRAGAARRADRRRARAGPTRRCCAGTSRVTASAASARRWRAPSASTSRAAGWTSAVHPSCTGLGPGDCRITLRFDDRDFAGGLFTILHEVGHGLYEQGLDPEHYGTPLGEAASVGMDEAQARFWENRVGRDRRFWDHFYPRARELFPESLGDVPLDEFHFAVNRVTPSLIRVQADEVTYNLHIMIRFDLERALISGALAVADLPEAWSAAYRATPRRHAAHRRRGLPAGRPLGRRDDRLLPDLHAGRRLRGPALRRAPSWSWAAWASSSRAASSRRWCSGWGGGSTGRAGAIRRRG